MEQNIQASEYPHSQQSPSYVPTLSLARILRFIIGSAIVFFLGLFVGISITNNDTKTTIQVPTPTPLIKTLIIPARNAYPTISTSTVSPDGTYTITERMEGDKTMIVLRKGTSVITDDLLRLNESAIGYNVKIHCQCGTKFVGWYSLSQFIIRITNGNGEEYEYVVAANSGKVDESSLQLVEKITLTPSPTGKDSLQQ